MDKFKNLPPQHKLLIGVAFLGLVAGLFYYLVIMDLDEKIGQYQTAYTVARRELDQFKDFRGEIEIAELQERYAGVLKKIEQNKKVIPTEDNVTQLLKSLEADALEAGLKLLSNEEKPRESENYYNVVPIKIQVSGSYLQLIKFLKLIAEPQKRLVAVDDIDIKKVEDKKLRKKQKDSPFGGGQVTNLESNIVASFTVKGFTYTGQPAAGKKK